jgi:hypothetical protein
MAVGENRKIFFLHPQAVIQDDLVRSLVEDNFEAYLVRNPVSAKTLIREFPDSVLLIQIDSGLSRDDWMSYATEVKSNPVFAALTLCVLSVSDAESLREPFLGDESPFSHAISYAKFDFGKTMRELQEYLTNEKTRLPRNQVRGTSPESLEVSVVFVRDEVRYVGSLKDITIAGLTCRLTQEELLPSEVPIPAIIVTYGKTQFSVVGRIAGKHGKDGLLHLILFDEGTKSERRKDIFDLIQACFQAETNAIIDAKSHKRQVMTKVPRANLYKRR